MIKRQVRVGELTFSESSRTIFHTTVDEGIVLCIWDRVKRCGGMYHFVFPKNILGRVSLSPTEGAREAIVSLLKRFKNYGSTLSDIEAYLLGAAYQHRCELSQLSGKKNIEMVIDVLSQFSIPITKKSIGGLKGREIRFNTAQGSLEYREVVLQDKEQLKIDTVKFKSKPNIFDFKPTKLILIGASTGGVEALETVLKQFPQNIPPICLVQHISKGFSGSLAESLNQTCRVHVCEAEDGVEVLNGHVYVSPSGKHMKIVQLGNDKLVLRLSNEPLLNGFRPSVDHLFNSATHIKGIKKVAILLSGMGCDGAAGMLALKQRGTFTIVQNEETSVVWGMARVAKEMNAVCRTVPLNSIPSTVMDALINKPKLRQKNHLH